MLAVITGHGDELIEDAELLLLEASSTALESPAVDPAGLPC
jgi:hypothetical protein